MDIAGLSIPSEPNVPKEIRLYEIFFDQTKMGKL